MRHRSGTASQHTCWLLGHLDTRGLISTLALAPWCQSLPALRSSVLAPVPLPTLFCFPPFSTACCAHPWSSFDLAIVLRYLASTLKSGDPLGVLMLRYILQLTAAIDTVSVHLSMSLLGAVLAVMSFQGQNYAHMCLCTACSAYFALCLHSKLSTGSSGRGALFLRCNIGTDSTTSCLSISSRPHAPHRQINMPTHPTPLCCLPATAPHH